MITNENIDEVLKERYFEKIKIFFEKNGYEKARIEYVKKYMAQEVVVEEAKLIL